MANTIEGVIAYARTHPKRDGATWHNWCESFVWRAGGFAGSFATARLAGDASGHLNSGPAPRAAIHYWGGTRDGHVGFELGNDTILMASDGVTDFWGTDMGTVSLRDYNRRKPSMKYRGWTYQHGTQTLAASSSTSGLNELDLDMGDASEASVQEAIRIGNVNYRDNQDIKAMLQAAVIRDSTDATEASVQEAIRIGNTSFGIITEIAAKPSTVIDATKLAAALNAAGIKVTVDNAALVAMIDKSLADNFAGIPAAVNKDAAARLAS